MRLILVTMGFGFSLYALVLVLLYFFQGRLLFFPGSGTFGACPEMERHGAASKSAGDIRYYVRETPSPERWIIIFHGNAGNACDRTYFFDLLKDLDAHLVVFEYPGYGKDRKKPGETLFLDQALKLVLHIKAQDTLPVYLAGESMGTGVATWVAGQTHIAGLILISPYTSLADVAQYHYPWFPVKFLMQNKFSAFAWARQTQAPAILFHGVHDDIIPIRFARQQYLNFKTEKKELVEILDCGHNDIIDVGEITLQQKIKNFLALTGKQ